jgi:hypothetical protein
VELTPVARFCAFGEASDEAHRGVVERRDARRPVVDVGGTADRHGLEPRAHKLGSQREPALFCRAPGVMTFSICCSCAIWVECSPRGETSNQQDSRRGDVIA